MIDKSTLLFKKSTSFKVVLWITALTVAASSAYYSVFGLSQLFAGASLSVALMASSLEIAKLISATFLHRYWEHISKVLKIYLTVGVVTLMLITSAGVYGFLSKAYEYTSNRLRYAEQQTKVLQAKRDIFVSKRESLQKDLQLREQRVATLNDVRRSQEQTYSQNVTRSRTARRLQNGIESTEKATENTYATIDRIGQEISSVSDSIARYETLIIDASNSDASQELGPLMYISRLTGMQMDVVINWFILLIVVVFDPLAVALVLAANFVSRRQLDISENEDVKIDYENTLSESDDRTKFDELSISTDSETTEPDVSLVDSTELMVDDATTTDASDFSGVDVDTDDTNDVIDEMSEAVFYGEEHASDHKTTKQSESTTSKGYEYVKI